MVEDIGKYLSTTGHTDSDMFSSPYVGHHHKMELIIVDLLNIDDEIQTKFSIYNLGGPAL